MSGPFKMKGSPMQRNFGISPVRRADVLINDEYEGTGAEALEKAKTQEKINEALANKGKTKDTSPKGKKISTQTVSYTGDDALAKALEDDDTQAYRDIKAGHMGTKENPYTAGMQHTGS